MNLFTPPDLYVSQSRDYIKVTISNNTNVPRGVRWLSTKTTYPPHGGIYTYAVDYKDQILAPDTSGWFQFENPADHFYMLAQNNLGEWKSCPVFRFGTYNVTDILNRHCIPYQ